MNDASRRIANLVTSPVFACSFIPDSKLNGWHLWNLWGRQGPLIDGVWLVNIWDGIICRCRYSAGILHKNNERWIIVPKHDSSSSSATFFYPMDCSPTLKHTSAKKLLTTSLWTYELMNTSMDIPCALKVSQHFLLGQIHNHQLIIWMDLNGSNRIVTIPPTFTRCKAQTASARVTSYPMDPNGA